MLPWLSGWEDTVQRSLSLNNSVEIYSCDPGGFMCSLILAADGEQLLYTFYVPHLDILVQSSQMFTDNTN